jgi:uncharacterized protein (TIGR02147 family)
MNYSECAYRTILREELEARCARNPTYSLRSFARDLGLAPARLSDVLRGRYGLSRLAAEGIAKRLGWNDQECDRFCDLVESEHGRDQRKREAARERLQTGVGSHYRQLTLDSFQVISEWYHYVILELAVTEDFQSDEQWISRQLGLNLNVTRAAIARLKRLDLLVQDEDGRLRPTEGTTASPDGVPSDAVKKFHRQVLEKAMRAIDFQDVEQRDLSSMILAIDTDQIPEAKKAIRKFRRDFDTKFGAAKKKNQVYCLATQFFRMSGESE